MTDKELLLGAIKATGADHEIDLDTGEIDVLGEIGGMAGAWNPLADDGDALRLAVKLNICIRPDICEDDEMATSAHIFRGGVFIEKHKGHPCAATRRAIVRAAAEIGTAQ